MPVRKLKPITPGQRFRIVNEYSEITTSNPEKSLLKTIKKTGGRNNQGRMTMRYKGGGHKKRYRIIDFKRDKYEIEAEVLSIEYDPFRSAFISLVKYNDGEKRYILAQRGLKVGTKIVSAKSAPPNTGNCMQLANIPLGTTISCIEMTPGKGASLARSAGSYAQLMAKEGKFVTIKLPSGETRLVLANCFATVGAVSRPVAMNPVDHPMGGGEGRASGGHPRSRKGVPAKGFRTRSKNKVSNKYILERRKK